MSTPNTPLLTLLATAAALLAGAVVGACEGTAHAAGPPAVDLGVPPVPEDAWFDEDCCDCGCGEPEPVELLVDEGETLSHYAAWSGIPAEMIAEDSGLDPAERLLPGQLVTLYLDDEAMVAEVARRKARFHAVRRARFLTEHPLADSVAHEVRAGETAWTLARDAGVPLWLLQQLNPGRDLSVLRAGTRLTLPVLQAATAGFAWELDEEPGC